MSNTSEGIAVPSKITHSFSRELANQYTVNAAIVLGYLGHKIQHSKHVHNGRQWYFDTLDSLTELYPYLSRTAIHDAIQHLTQNNGPLITGNFNKRGYDRTTWYAFRDARTAQLLETNPVYYKVSDAVAYGVLEAILICNLAYWLTEKRKEKPDYRFHPMSPKTLAKHLPYAIAEAPKGEVVNVQVLSGSVAKQKQVPKINENQMPKPHLIRFKSYSQPSAMSSPRSSSALRKRTTAPSSDFSGLWVTIEPNGAADRSTATVRLYE